MGATSRAGGNGRSLGSKRFRRGAATAVLVALLALTAAPGVTAQEQPAGKLTFTVGILNDVDSLNPFIGILSESYEVWALMYDYLIVHSQKDFSPGPRAGRVLGGLRRRADLDLQDPPGGEVVRRPAAHGQGRRLHLQPDHEGQLRADQLRQLRLQHQDRRGPRRRHLGDDHQGTQPDHAPTGRADPARAHLEGHRREGGHDLRQREGCRRLGPVRARRAQHRPVRAPDGQQVLLGRRPQDRRGRATGSSTTPTPSSRR